MTDRPARLTHLTVTAADFAGSVRFYDAAFAALGMPRVVDYGDEEESESAVEAAAWGPAGGAPLFWLVSGPTPTSGLHVEFTADDRDQVERFHAAAVAAGGASRAAPRRWTIYRVGRFGATVLDPDGNLVEVTAPE